VLGATSAAVSHGSGLLASRARLLLTPLSPGGHSPGLNLFRMFTTHQIRKLYLDYFQTKGHTLVPGCSLVPPNDKSLLFTNSGTSPSSSAPGLLSGSQSFFFSPFCPVIRNGAVQGLLSGERDASLQVRRNCPKLHEGWR